MSPRNRWEEFASPEYQIKDIGREFLFYFPASKVHQRLDWKTTVEEKLHSFLVANFTGFTRTTIPSFGVWHDGQVFHFDQCYRYEISFLGKDKIPMLISELSSLARLVDERCVYIGAGQYRALVFPCSPLWDFR